MKKMFKFVLLSLVALLLAGSTGCFLSYRLVWDYGTGGKGPTGALGWEMRDQYYAYKGEAAYVMINNSLGVYPKSVTWSMSNHLGILDDRDLPDHKRMFSAGLAGGETSIFATYGPKAGDFRCCKVIVFPSYNWTTLGSNLDLDSDEITDVTCPTEQRLVFPFGVRFESVNTRPDYLASIPTDVTAPDLSITEWDPYAGRRTLVFASSKGKVFAGVCSWTNGVPGLAYRQLR